MSSPAADVTIAMRIPGQWSHPREMIERMPADCRLTPQTLVLPDGTQMELGFMDADDQFPGIFRSACRQPPTDEELAAVDGYTVNVLLSGPGGSLDAARATMQAAAAFVRAGAAGVFIDNCLLAHGGQNRLELSDDGGPDALSFALVGIARGEREVYTMGMHSLGLRDVVMKRTDVEVEGFDIVDVIRYLAASEHTIEDGHVIADLNGPKF